MKPWAGGVFGITVSLMNAEAYDTALLFNSTESYRVLNMASLSPAWWCVSLCGVSGNNYIFYLELDIFVQKFKIKVYLHIYGVEMINYWCQSEKLCSHAGSVSFAQSSVFTKHKTPWIRKCAKPNLTVIHSFRSIFYTSTHIWGSHMVPLSHISLSLICSANGPVGQNRADMKNHSFPEWFMGLNIRSHSSIPHQRV